MKTLKITAKTHQKLQLFKVKNELKNFDTAIQNLLKNQRAQ